MFKLYNLEVGYNLKINKLEQKFKAKGFQEGVEKSRHESNDQVMDKKLKESRQREGIKACECQAIQAANYLFGSIED